MRYIPVQKDGMVGYACITDYGKTTYLYFNPSPTDEDGPNVFVYQGSMFDPAVDMPMHHYSTE
jgi:hypothetical protein